MKPVIIGLGDDVDENARRFMKALGLSDEEIERRIRDRNHVMPEEEVLEGFKNFFDE